ncbi:MAG TPA: tail fiber protein [Allosphingosinicella sp.]|nr:tail fiber protein [Allosphingosinicella sp.]
MPQLVALAGIFPSRDDGHDTPYFYTAMVQPFAGAMAAYGAPPAQGQELPIDSMPNEALFAIMGMAFGGDGFRNFALPNLKGRTAIGGQQIGQFNPQSLVLTYLIAATPSAGAPLPGMVALFAGNYAPDGWLVADGSVLPISPYVPLFETIGTAFGGNGATNFALPDLNGAAAVGIGQGPGLPPVARGETVSGAVAGLGLNYLICSSGAYPSGSGDGYLPSSGQFLGQVIAFAGASPPQGWAVCDGSLLPINGETEELYVLIGTTYGGDGEQDFALPDLRGRMLTGT